MTLPREVFVRRSDVLGCGLGITKYALTKAVRLGLVTRHVFPGMTYGRYRRAEIWEVFGRFEQNLLRSESYEGQEVAKDTKGRE